MVLVLVVEWNRSERKEEGIVIQELQEEGVGEDRRDDDDGGNSSDDGKEVEREAARK